MIKIFTPNDVIRYVYEETSEQENLEIEQALIVDSELSDLYKELKSSVNMLDEASKEPSDQVLKNIMAYARSKNENSVCK